MPKGSPGKRHFFGRCCSVILFTDNITLIDKTGVGVNDMMKGKLQVSWVHNPRRQIDDDVAHHIGARLVNWRLTISVPCYKNVSKLKGKFYRMAIRPTLLYGVEGWPVNVQKIKVAEMRMIK
ncbi:hypothetical protein H5410_035180 [Solanum commersonii]|uniref:Uncharacterized protein n=1 Tax=Solanum commersonii TaxID=4109 RepID=A0A9J5Y3V8_SOLCO|nr:hypothetical protein H5410_035180 [Solanum commersonii]